MSISGFPKTAVYEFKRAADVGSSNPLPVGGKSVQNQHPSHDPL